MKRTGAAIAAIAFALACSGERSQTAAPDARTATAAKPAAAAAKTTIEEVVPPAGTGAAEPFLFATKDGVLLSWLEPAEGPGRTALRFSRHAGGQWSAPATIVERDDLFVNWADFPSVVEDGKGVLFAHWLQKSGSDTYSYDVRMSVSADGGAAWGEPFLLNRDGRKAEHGFVSLAPLAEGGVAATWLDGRNMTGGEHDHGGGEMTLRYATVSAGGELAGDVQLDARTCECCATGMAIGPGGPVIVYRDRSPEEIRDISFVRRTTEGWSEPRGLNADGWKINGCPVNGPQIDAAGSRLVSAWFTAAGEKQKVYVAFSSDGGASFGAPVQVDDGKPVGRVDVVMLDEESALVVWLEQTEAGAEIRARRVSAAGQTGPTVKIADTSAARAAGFTRIARTPGHVWFSWTDHAESGSRVRVARMGV